MERRLLVAAGIVSLLLLGWSCKNKFASVNVNTNAVANSAQQAFNTVVPVATREAAVAEAKGIFISQESKGIDFSNGPCLSDSLMPDWVADIAHDPRQPVDDEPGNQCPAFREGKAHHFVELNPEGGLIRTQ